jgi:tetratricopeptide (TPR) repeat protein
MDALVAHERPGLSRRVALGLFFLALVLRATAWLEVAESAWGQILLGDARFFDEWGLRLAQDGWREPEAFYQAPLYPYLLGGLYALFGHAPKLVYALQSLLGAVAVVWIADATARLTTRRAGLAAGLVAALYAPAIWYELQLEKTSLAYALTAWLLWSTLARPPTLGAGRWVSAGVGLGALTLLRENAAVLLLPLAWCATREPGGRAARFAALLLGLTLPLAPVAWHNAVHGGTALPTAANAGVNFYIGNGAEADGQYRPLVPGRGHADFEREDARRIAETLAGRELSPAGVSNFWFARAGREIREEPAHFLWLLGWKLRLLAHRTEIMDAVALEVFQDESRLLRGLGPFSFGLLLPLALAGAVVLVERDARRALLVPALLLALSILAFFVVARFRLGFVPFLHALAGIALGRAWSSSRRLGAVLALALGLGLAWWPIASEGDPRATSAANLASELLRRGEPEAAVTWAREAVRLDPSSAEAAFNLGSSLRAVGRGPEALAPFESALRLEPAYAADCWAEIGAIHAVAGDRERAEEALGRALALDPTHAAALRYRSTLAGLRGSE